MVKPTPGPYTIKPTPGPYTIKPTPGPYTIKPARQGGRRLVGGPTPPLQKSTFGVGTFSSTLKNFLRNRCIYLSVSFFFLSRKSWTVILPTSI